MYPVIAVLPSLSGAIQLTEILVLSAMYFTRFCGAVGGYAANIANTGDA
jgi:hypothetical protein